MTDQQNKKNTLYYSKMPCPNKTKQCSAYLNHSNKKDEVTHIIYNKLETSPILKLLFTLIFFIIL